MKRVPLLIAVCVLLAVSSVAGQELAIEKEPGEIRIIQKHPAPEPEVGEERDQSVAGDAGPEDGAPPQKPGDVTPEEAPQIPEAEQAPPAPQPRERSDNKKEKVSLEDNPDYVKALSALNEEYNDKLQKLQDKVDEMLRSHNARMLMLRGDVSDLQVAIDRARERNVSRDVYRLQDRQQELLEQMQILESRWQLVRGALRQEKEKLDSWYRKRKDELIRNFS